MQGRVGVHVSLHDNDVIMSAMASQITGASIVCPTVCLGKKTSKLRVNGLCEGNSPVTGEFPAQRASNAENVSIWWRHHDQAYGLCLSSLFFWIFRWSNFDPYIGLYLKTLSICQLDLNTNDIETIVLFLV